MDVVGLLGQLVSLLVAGQAQGGCPDLVRLDQQRTAAFVAADPAALADVYTGPEAAEADLAVLRGYTSRGLRLTGMRLTLLDCRPVPAVPGEVQLRVVDRLGPTWVVDPLSGARRLPDDTPDERVVVLRATADGWRVAESR